MNEHTAETHAAGTHTQSRCMWCETNERMGNMWKAFGPSEEVKGHFRQSRIEFWKGVRRLIDERIDDLGRGEAKGTRVVVE